MSKAEQSKAREREKTGERIERIDGKMTRGFGIEARSKSTISFIAV